MLNGLMMGVAMTMVVVMVVAVVALAVVVIMVVAVVVAVMVVVVVVVVMMVVIVVVVRSFFVRSKLDSHSYLNGASCEVQFSVNGGGQFEYKARVVETERAFKCMVCGGGGDDGDGGRAV